MLANIIAKAKPDQQQQVRWKDVIPGLKEVHSWLAQQSNVCQNFQSRLYELSSLIGALDAKIPGHGWWELPGTLQLLRNLTMSPNLDDLRLGRRGHKMERSPPSTSSGARHRSPSPLPHSHSATNIASSPSRVEDMLPQAFSSSQSRAPNLGKYSNFLSADTATAMRKSPSRFPRLKSPFHSTPP